MTRHTPDEPQWARDYQATQDLRDTLRKMSIPDKEGRPITVIMTAQSLTLDNTGLVITYKDGMRQKFRPEVCTPMLVTNFAHAVGLDDKGVVANLLCSATHLTATRQADGSLALTGIIVPAPGK